MKAIRISATDIDAYRRFLSPPDGFEIELDDLLRQLRREEPPTEAMMAGTALHSLLETASAGELESAESEGYHFTFKLDGEIDLPEIREAKDTKEFQIGDVMATVVGKVDAVRGRRIDDHKMTSRYDAERFLASYQWRIYLDIFEADEFVWNVFEARETGPKEYVISNLHRLRAHRYPAISEDVKRAVAAFVGFAREFLPERFTVEPA